jgi:hypothetical protein
MLALYSMHEGIETVVHQSLFFRCEVDNVCMWSESTSHKKILAIFQIISNRKLSQKRMFSTSKMKRKQTFLVSGV